MLKKVLQYAPIWILLLFICFLFVLLDIQHGIGTESLKSNTFTPATLETITDGKININEANADMLTLLDGIGPSLAGRIVEYREQNGPFRTTSELLNITGIGRSTFQKIRDYITVGG